MVFNSIFVWVYVVMDDFKLKRILNNISIKNKAQIRLIVTEIILNSSMNNIHPSRNEMQMFYIWIIECVNDVDILGRNERGTTGQTNLFHFLLKHHIQSPILKINVLIFYHKWITSNQPKFDVHKRKII